MRTACLVFLLLMQATAAQGASAGSVTIVKGAGLQADVDILQRAYETMHPGLYRYNSPEQMAAHFAALRRTLNHDQPMAEAYLALSAFTATIRCGHTYPNFFNQTDAVANELFEHADRLPFLFRWLDRRMIVTRNLSADARLLPGSEVLTIDGVSASAILDRLLVYSRADGNNAAKRISNLDLLGNARFEAFDVYFPLVFPSQLAERMLRVRPPRGASEITITIATMTPAQRSAALMTNDATEPSADAPLWTLDHVDDRTSLLRMPSWVLYKTKWDWKAWLDGAFGELAEKHVANLVIDLRDNEGGSSVGDEILAHLIDKNLPQHAFRRLVRYRKAPDDLLPYLDTWDRSFADWGAAAVDDRDGFYQLTRYDDTAEGGLIRPRGPYYRGKVWVIVDASNSSATFEFEAAAQDAHLATLVGAATGGNRRGLNGGAFFFLRLPNSKLEVDLPLIGQFPTIPAADAALVPDLRVVARASDIASGTDVELAVIRRRIEASRR